MLVSIVSPLKPLRAKRKKGIHWLLMCVILVIDDVIKINICQ